jgi:hypothetical protein
VEMLVLCCGVDGSPTTKNLSPLLDRRRNAAATRTRREEMNGLRRALGVPAPSKRHGRRSIPIRVCVRSTSSWAVLARLYTKSSGLSIGHDVDGLRQTDTVAHPFLTTKCVSRLMFDSFPFCYDASIATEHLDTLDRS